ncbi:head maturation protease, ClpP-related [Ruoffia sp. FAM 24228]|uniref:head maturation protease, ClpP-related n=1 Tax=Ruoffia sp. FAM 24228 TaxID=3259517 RepID=UPI00388CFB66
MNDKLRKMARNIKPKISNEVIDNKLVITLSGSVGEPYWFDDKEEDFINEQRVKSLVGDSKQDIIIKLNSPGGDVFEGIATYNYLNELDNHVTIEVTALAASAASIIAMAGDEIVMCMGSQMMIHEASTVTWGNKADHYKTINALETIDSSIVSVYAEKTGIDRDEITDWLSGETWFTAEEAVEKGIANALKERPKPIENKTVTVQVDGEAIANKVIAHFENKYGISASEPKTGLSKIFGGKK